MVSNLEKIKNNLRAIAKRCKTIKYSAALVVTYAMLGANAFSEEAVISSSELKTETSKLSQILKEIQEENDKKLKGVNLELTQLMEQGDQVVKSPWASWQFGLNYFYDNNSGEHKGRGDKKDFYSYEGKFTRSNDLIERSVAPNSPQYSKLTRGTDPTSATTTNRTGLTSNRYGIASTTTVEEPIVSFERNVGIRPRTIVKESLNLKISDMRNPRSPNFNLSFNEVPSINLPEAEAPSTQLEIAEANAKPFIDFGSERRAYNTTDSKKLERWGDTDGSLNDDDRYIGNHKVIWQGFKPEVSPSGELSERGEYIISGGTKIGSDNLPEKPWTGPGGVPAYPWTRGEANNYTNPFKVHRMIFMRHILNRSRFKDLTGTFDESADYPETGGGYFGGDSPTGRLKIYIAGNVEGTGPANVVSPYNNGVIAMHATGNVNLEYIDTYLKGRAAFLAIETWQAPKIALKDINVSVSHNENTIFLFYPTDYTNLFNRDRYAPIKRGATMGAVNVDLKSQSNTIYNLVGITGAYNIRSTGTYRLEGAKNIVYSGIGYAPNYENLERDKDPNGLTKTSPVYGPANNGIKDQNMRPLINIVKAPEIYGDENTVLFFSDLVPDGVQGYAETAVGGVGGSRPNDERWKRTKIGIYQGEIAAKARIGEQLAIDGSATEQTAEGNTKDSNKYVESSVGILAKSGQREGIDLRDLGATDEYFKNDPICSLQINDIDVTFGKYSLGNMMVVSENGTKVDVVMPENNHFEIGLRADDIYDYNRNHNDYTNDGKILSSAVEATNEAATGTIIAYAKGKWSDGLREYTDKSSNKISFSNTKLSDEKSEINLGKNITMTAKSGEVAGKKYTPIAYVADGGLINAKGADAKGYGSVIAYATNGGEITVAGDIKAIDEWTASDSQTKAELNKNMGAYATGMNSKITITGNSEIRGIGAFSETGAEIKLEGKDNKISVGESIGLVAKSGSKISFGGGTIEVGSNSSDNSMPFLAEANSKIDFANKTTINMTKGFIQAEAASDYAAASGYTARYNGMENVTLNLSGTAQLTKISNGESIQWTGTTSLLNSLKNDMKLRSLHVDNIINNLSLYYVNGNMQLDTDVNLDDNNDAFNNIRIEREKVTINANRTLSSTNGRGLSQSSNTKATVNTETGYINKGTINITGGTQNQTIALGVNYGHIQNNNIISLDNGTAIYGANGSKLENTASGKINISGSGYGIVGSATGNKAQNYGRDKNAAINAIEIENKGTINIAGKDSIGIYADNNKDYAQSQVKITNSGKINVGDESIGIAVKSGGTKGGTINLTGTGNSDIVVGSRGIGVQAEHSIVNLNSTYGIDTKEDGIGMYLTGKSTMPTNNTLNYKYLGTAGGQGTAIVYDNITTLNPGNSANIKLENQTNGRLIGVYVKNTLGNFTNDANIRGTSTANEIGIAGDNTNIVNNGVITLGNAISNANSNVGIYSKNNSITNNNKVTVGNNSIAIYGNDITSSGVVKSGDTGIGIYSIDGNINVSGAIEVGANEATAVYSKANNKNITLGNASTMTIGSNSFGIVNKGSGNQITTNIQTVNLPSESVFLYSNDTKGTVKSTTNLTNTNSTGNNYGIYSAGTVTNKGDIDFTNGIGNIGVYSVAGGTATNYGNIKVGATDAADNRYSIGMAAGAKAENGIQATTGNIINKGTIEVKGKDSVGMYATQAGSSAKNDRTIILDADNTIGIYADEGATAENTGTITTGTGNYKNVTGVYLGKNSTLNNTGTINIVSNGGQGVYLKGGTITNYGTITVGGAAKETHQFQAKDTTKTIGGVTINAPAGATSATITTTAPNGQTITKAFREDAAIITHENDTAGTVSANSIGMYIDTSGIRFTNPIQNLGTLTKEADLIVGTEATLNTNSKAIKIARNNSIGRNMLDPYNQSIINNPQVTNWNIYSGGLTWMSTATLDRTDGTMTNLYLAKIPYTEFTKDKNTYNFLDGLEQRYDMNALDSKEKRVFNKLNSIGKNEEILFHQAVDEMMGHQYANVQQRIHETSRILDKEFKYLKNEWRTMSKDSNKIKVFGMRGEYSTDTAGIIDYKSNAYGVAYLGENETFKLGETSGWYTGLVENTFKFKDIGNSKEKQLQGKLGVFKSKAFDDNNSLNWTISGEGFVGYNKMDRRYLVVDKIFGAKSNYWSYGVALRNELSKDFRMTESTNFKVYGAVKAEYGRYEKIKEKSGEVRLEVKSNDYLSIKPEIGAELGYKKALSNRYFLNTKLNVAYENELGKLSDVDNKARVGYTNAGWYTLRSEKEDRRGNIRTDLSVGLDNERYGVTANIGYDTKGKNRRAGLGLRVIF